jgi:hypothetical protein
MPRVIEGLSIFEKYARIGMSKYLVMTTEIDSVTALATRVGKGENLYVSPIVRNTARPIGQ